MWTNRKLVRVVFELDDRVNLAQASARYSKDNDLLIGGGSWAPSRSYFNLLVETVPDFNCHVDELPEWINEKIALLKLVEKNVCIEDVGFKEGFAYSGVSSVIGLAVSDVYYVDTGCQLDDLIKEIRNEKD